MKKNTSSGDIVVISPTQIEPRCVGIAGAASYLGTTVNAIRKLVRKRKLKAIQYEKKGTLYFDLRVLDEFIDYSSSYLLECDLADSEEDDTE